MDRTWPFDSFGYQRSAYLKGKYPELDPAQCYKIEDVGGANSAEQYHLVPVNAERTPLGPAPVKTAGQMMYGIWDGGRGSDYDISDDFI